ncbi:nucleoside recognition domain-containing protein [Paenibacillus sp. sgz500958]|uniref:nucleoside recognition domain-containing protein n=1 Tax=Paenibacillus sp. sgz500958 TaxID=3242475 RepID=UPI0036D210DA
MNVKINRISKSSAPFLSGAVAIFLAVAIISSPEASFQASLGGVKLWWNLVFPALLPFLILSEMLTASGFVHGIGVLLEPLMRKIFRLPGAGAWTLVQGLTAGFPSGAQGVLQLHKQGSVSDKEAGRLAALVHFGSPVTLLIVVGVAFLHSPATGYGLLAIHWISGLLSGLTAGYIGRRRSDSTEHPPSVASDNISHTSLYRRVLGAAIKAHSEDGRNFGRLLGESVTNSVQSLMIVGGYMIIFSVITSIILRLFPALPTALPAGILEIHLGAQSLTDGAAVIIPIWNGTLKIALLSAALAWSGICSQLQVLTILKPVGISYLPFAGVRLLHASYAYLLTILLWKPLMTLHEEALPAFAAPGTFDPWNLRLMSIWSTFPVWLTLQAALLLLLFLLSVILSLFSALKRGSN